MSTPADVRVLSSRSRFRGRVFEVVEESIVLPSGLRQDLAIVAHGGAVCVAPLLDDGRLLCVRQYRHAVGEHTLEIPAGRLEEGEEPLVAARRELEEETGHAADDWSPALDFLPAPGFCSERLFLFVARGLRALPDGGRDCDPDEEIALETAAPAELVDGRTRDAKTLIAALLLLAGRL